MSKDNNPADEFRQSVKIDAGIATSIRNPKSQIKIVNVPGPSVPPFSDLIEHQNLCGIPVLVTRLVKPGKIYSIPQAGLVINPLDWWIIQHDGRLPFQTDHSLGMRERDRDRRRNR